MTQSGSEWLNAKDIVFKQIKKTVKIYCIWNIIYLPLAVYWYIEQGYSIGKAIVDYIRGFFFIGEHYNSWALWYLLGAIYAFAFFLICLKLRLSFKCVIILSFFISFFSILMTLEARGLLSAPPIIHRFFSLINIVFFRGRVFTGIPYITFGMFISKIKDKELHRFVVWLLCVLSLILCSFTSFVGFAYEITRAVCSCALFYSVIKIEVSYNKAFVYSRDMSQVIYYLHLLIWTILYMVLFGEKTYGLTAFINTTIVCLIISLVYCQIKERRKRMFKHV